MPHLTVVRPSPHPDNSARTMTLHGNTDCPRCGSDLGGIDAEPDDLLHCPKCRGPLVACARMEDGGVDRTADLHVFGWFAPTDGWGDDECDCAGCSPHDRGEG
jgi:hypothetical protein